jgi:predicted O-methyltransferase YrrM
MAALAVPEARFVGVEWRPHLVRLATRLAAGAGVSNVRFIHGDALDLDWSDYDAFYFYNPFAEHLFDGVFGLDHTIELDPLDYVVYVNAVTERLARARVGTRVVTYHGLGTALPDAYFLAKANAMASDTVELWIKGGSAEVVP